MSQGCHCKRGPLYWICWSYDSSSKSGSRIRIKTPKSDSGSGSRDGIVTSSLFTVFIFPIEFDLKIVWISSAHFLPPPLFFPAAKPAGQEVVQGSHFGGGFLKSSTLPQIVKPSKQPQSHNNHHRHYCWGPWSQQWPMWPPVTRCDQIIHTFKANKCYHMWAGVISCDQLIHRPIITIKARHI